MTELRKVRIKRIKDFKMGDVVYSEDDSEDVKEENIGLVISFGETFFHNHIYVKIRWDDDSTDKLMKEDFSDNEFVWRRK